MAVYAIVPLYADDDTSENTKPAIEALTVLKLELVVLIRRSNDADSILYYEENEEKLELFENILVSKDAETVT